MGESTTLHEKMIKVQAELRAPKGQYNDFSNFHYRSCEDILEAVKPLLHASGLMLTLSDEVVAVGDRIYVKATAAVTDGTESRAAFGHACEPAQKKGMDSSQITGAASSYARKYALNGLFCIDDSKDADTLGTITVTPEQVKKIKGRIETTGANEEKFLDYIRKAHGAESIEEIPASAFSKIMGMFQGKVAK